MTTKRNKQHHIREAALRPCGRDRPGFLTLKKRKALPAWQEGLFFARQDVLGKERYEGPLPVCGEIPLEGR